MNRKLLSTKSAAYALGALTVAMVAGLATILPDRGAAEDSHVVPEATARETLAGNGRTPAQTVIDSADEVLRFKLRLPGTLPPGLGLIHATASSEPQTGIGQIDFTYGASLANGTPDIAQPLVHLYQSNDSRDPKPLRAADKMLIVGAQEWELRRLLYPQPGGSELVILELRHSFPDGVTVWVDTRVRGDEQAALEIVMKAAESLE